MISKRYAALSLALAALMATAGLIGTTYDGRTTIPFRAAGMPNDVMSRAAAYLTLPAIAAAAWLFFAAIWRARKPLMARPG
jgi:hypothetical protein